MSLPQTQTDFTVDEYLELERKSEERHEYLDGMIYEMAGETPPHGIICTNIGGQLYTQLRGKPCLIFIKDTKVRSGPIPRGRNVAKGLFSYPDLLVVCGEMEFHDKHRDVLLNPTVIIEVLSPATEAFDRGEKFWRYRTHLPSLKDYLMVSQSMPMIDHCALRSGEWVITTVTGLDGTLEIPSINCTLRLADVYDRIDFSKEPRPTPKPRRKINR